MILHVNYRIQQNISIPTSPHKIKINASYVHQAPQTAREKKGWGTNLRMLIHKITPIFKRKKFENFNQLKLYRNLLLFSRSHILCS